MSAGESLLIFLMIGLPIWFLFVVLRDVYFQTRKDVDHYMTRLDIRQEKLHQEVKMIRQELERGNRER